VKIMLRPGQSANETFSAHVGRVEGHSRDGSVPRRPRFGHQNRVGRIGPRNDDSAKGSATMAQGDQVVFQRLDLAEILGIWRHARGRIVGIHQQSDHSATVDVKFEGHETLERYLADLFELVP
jgi:hypothetical protein